MLHELTKAIEEKAAETAAHVLQGPALTKLEANIKVELTRALADFENDLRLRLSKAVKEAFDEAREGAA